MQQHGTLAEERSASKRVLYSVELLPAILDEIALGYDVAWSSRRTFAKCATVCQDWCIPVLRSLWRHISLTDLAVFYMRLKTAFRSLPAVVVGERYFPIDYEKETIKRWEFYSSFVISLQATLGSSHDRMRQILGGALQQPNVLLPCLRELTLAAPSDLEYALSHRFLLGKSLQTLTVNMSVKQYLWPDPTTMHSLLPNLRTLSIQPHEYGQLDAVVPAEFEAVVSNLVKLTRLSIPSKCMDTALLRAVACHPSLEILNLRSAKRPTYDSWLHDIEHMSIPKTVALSDFSAELNSSFISLRCLHLPGSDDEIKMFLSDFLTSASLEQLFLSVERFQETPHPSRSPCDSIFPKHFPSFNTLTCITFDHASKSRPANLEEDIPPQFNWLEMLRPLSHCQRLQILRITTKYQVDLDDESLFQLSSNWIDLREINLADYRASQAWRTPPLTLKALAILALHCPLLGNIRLFIGPSLETMRSWKDDTIALSRLRHLRELGLGSSFIIAPQEDNWCKEFADLLCQIIPSKCMVWGGKEEIEFARYRHEESDEIINLDNPFVQLEFRQRDIWERVNAEILRSRQQVGGGSEA